jgi:hypothetical protein
MGWMCIDLPQFVTGVDVKERQDEEDHGKQEHECILHAKTPGSLSTEMFCRTGGKPRSVFLVV